MIWIRALLLLLQPVRIWKDIDMKPASVVFVLTMLIFPLALITSAVRLTIQELPDKVFLISIGINVVAVLVSVSLGSFMVWRLAPRFLSRGPYKKALNLAAYSYIAVFLAFIISSIHPQLEPVKYFGLYSLYLYWVELSYMLKTPDERKTGFTFISALILTGTGYLVSIILNLALL